MLRRNTIVVQIKRIIYFLHILRKEGIGQLKRGQIEANIDSPEGFINLDNPLRVNGWAVSNSTIDQILVYLDGVLLGSAAYGIERKDVMAKFPWKLTSCAGFEGSFTLKKDWIGLQPHKLEVVITNEKGQATTLSKTVNFSLSPTTYTPTQNTLKYRYRWQGFSLTQWLDYNKKNNLPENTLWRGHSTEINPLDGWILQELLYDVKPDLIVELGTQYPGDLLFIADMLDFNHRGLIASCYTSTKEPQPEHQRLSFLTKMPGDKGFLEELIKLSENKRTLVFITPTKNTNLLSMMNSLSQIVSLHSYLIVRNGITDLFNPEEHFDERVRGVLGTLEEFLETNSSFETDLTKERYIVTDYPMGYLKRIR